MAKKQQQWIQGLARDLDEAAGKRVRQRILQGSEALGPASTPGEFAAWVKGALERMNRILDEKTKDRIMEERGRNCARVNPATLHRVMTRRSKYKSVDEFIEAEKNKLLPGMRLEKEGKILYQYYLPRSLARPMRCFCSLLRELPEKETVSRTYCQCSLGFVKEMWERLLAKPVRVDVVATAVTGARECKFKIHL
jgi:hypothetical protein